MNGHRLIASSRLDERSSGSGVAEDLRNVGCPVSVCYAPITQSDWVGDRIRRMVCGELHEVSVVPRAAVPGAQVQYTWPRPKAAARVEPLVGTAAPTRPATEDEVFYGDGIVVRRNLGTVFRVR